MDNIINDFRIHAILTVQISPLRIQRTIIFIKHLLADLIISFGDSRNRYVNFLIQPLKECLFNG